MIPIPFLILFSLFLQSRCVNFNIPCFTNGRELNVTNNGGSDIEKAQVLLHIDSTDLPFKKPDCSDLTFKNPNEDYYYPFWIESGCGGEMNVWLEITNFTADLTISIWMYYGCESSYISTSEYDFDGEFMLLSNGNCPDDTYEEDNHNGKILRASSSYSVTKGEPHTHFAAFFMDLNDPIKVPSGLETEVCGGSHTHNFFGEIGESLNYVPSSRGLRGCMNNEPIIMENNPVFFFRETDSEGTSPLSGYDEYFIRIDDNFDPEGSDTHLHNCSYNTENANCNIVKSYIYKYGSSNGVADHFHKIIGNSSTHSNIPNHFYLTLQEVSAEKSINEKMVFLATSLPPLGWNEYDANGYYLRNGATSKIESSITTNNLAHKHDIDDISLSVPSASKLGNFQKASSGWGIAIASYNHDHGDITAVMSTATNVLPTIGILTITRMSSNFNYSFGEKEKINRDNITCVPDCKPNGNCTGINTCTCFYGWGGSICNITVCNPPCVHGKCTGIDICTCYDGYSGDNCSEFSCDGCVHGKCVSPNNCSCETDWDGENCDVPNCDVLDNCSYPNGECILPNTCQCKGGYDNETFCKNPICEPNCYMGKCIKPYTCSCKDKWEGEVCSIPICKENKCFENQGTCSLPETCLCYKGYNGSRCEIPICDPACKNGGICEGPDKCNCTSEWTGIICEIPVCDPECLNGNCTEPGKCECFSGWNESINDGCSTPICEKGCGNGECISPGTCKCTSGWESSENSDIYCSVPICEDGCVNGECTGPNKCRCEDGWQGNDCSKEISGIAIAAAVIIPLLAICCILILVVAISIVIISVIRKKKGAKMKAIESIIVDSALKEHELETKREEIEKEKKSMEEVNLKNEKEKENLKKELENLRKESEKNMLRKLKLEIVPSKSIEVGEEKPYGLSAIKLFKGKWKGKEVIVREIDKKIFEAGVDVGVDILQFLKVILSDFSIIHPNIIQNYALSEDDKILLVSQDVKYFSFKHIAAIRGLKFGTKIRILYELAMAINALHKKGIKHGRINEKCVFLTESLKPILDFNFKDFLRNEDILNDSYVAPETIVGFEKYEEDDDEDEDDEDEEDELVDRKELKCDIYAFGILSYNLLTQDFDPYKAEKLKTQKAQHIKRNSIAQLVAEDKNFNIMNVSLKEKVKRYPNWWVNLIQQCTSQNPHDRPNSNTIMSIVQNVLDK